MTSSERLFRTEPTAEMPAMADYGVESATWQPLPWSWAEDRLVASHNYWLITVSRDLQPHALPMWGVWDPSSNTFGFACSRKARKLRNILENPLVSVANEDSAECVSVQGRARILAQADTGFDPFVASFTSKYREYSPDTLDEFIEASAIVCVEPETAFGIIEREEEFALRATRWRFAR